MPDQNELRPSIKGHSSPAISGALRVIGSRLSTEQCSLSTVCEAWSTIDWEIYEVLPSTAQLCDSACLHVTFISFFSSSSSSSFCAILLVLHSFSARAFFGQGIWEGTFRSEPSGERRANHSKHPPKTGLISEPPGRFCLGLPPTVAYKHRTYQRTSLAQSNPPTYTVDLCPL